MITRTFQPTKHNRRGAVLLFCLGILALMSLLGAALFMAARQEVQSSQSYLDETRARFACESGIDTALAKLASYSGDLVQLPNETATLPNDPKLPLKHLLQSSFPAEDTTGDGLKDAAGIVSETYRQNGDAFRLRVESSQGKLNVNDDNGYCNLDSDPYEDQLYPERNLLDLPEHMRPQIITWVGPPFNRRRVSTPTHKDPDWVYPDDADYDPVKAGPGNHPHPRAPKRLQVILRELVDVLFETPGLGNEVAEKILRVRDDSHNGRFSSVDEIRSALVPNLLTEGQCNLLLSKLTLNAWRDDSVLNPTFQWRISRPAQDPAYFPADNGQNFVGALFGLPPDLFGRPQFGCICPEAPDDVEWDPDGDNATDIYLREDMQTAFFEKGHRSPVDVNNTSLVLLKALIRPLSGWRMKEAPNTPGELTAEDWSRPSDAHLAIPASHLWFGTGLYNGACYIRQMELGGTYGHCPAYGTDFNQYYFHDEMFPIFLLDEGTPYYDFKRKCARFGELKQISLAVNVADAVAEKIYQRVHSSGGYTPLRSWEEVEMFILDLVDGKGSMGIPGFDTFMADMLIANFNPNSRVNDFNPNKTLYLHTDKSKLIVNTAEFCFHTMGYFEIGSLGWCRGNDGTFVSSSTVKAGCNSGLRPFKVTTQNQFYEGYDPANGGKQASDFCSESNGVTRTSGLHFLPDGTGDSSYNGHSVQSYPEPEIPLNNVIKDSAYDGYLMLAAYRPNPFDLTSDPAKISLFANYTMTLNADMARNGNKDIAVDHAVDYWVNDPNASYRSGNADIPAKFYIDSDFQSKVPGDFPHANTLMPSMKQHFAGPRYRANLYVDGAFSGTGASLRYDAENFGDPVSGGKKGTLQFWIKPGFDVAHSNRIRSFFSVAPKDREKYYRNDAGMNGYLWTTNFWARDFSLFYFAHGGSRAGDPLLDNAPIYSPDIGRELYCTRSLYMHAVPGSDNDLFCYERFSGLGSTTANFSWQNEAPAALGNPLFNLETRQWSHVCFRWDFTQPLMPLPVYMDIALNGKMIDEDRHVSAGIDMPSLQTLEGGRTNHVRFGESSTSPFRNFVADSTYDDIVISILRENIATLPTEFSYGRYCEGEDSAYLSPKFDMEEILRDSGNRASLLQISWTAYIPRKDNPALPANDRRFNDMSAPNSDTHQNIQAPIRPATFPGIKYPQDPMSAYWGKEFVFFSVDIENPATKKWFYEERSITDPVHKPHFAGGSKDDLWEKELLWTNKDNFRFKIHFNIEGGQTLYASPILDDILFMFQTNKSRILSWEPDFE